MVPRLSCALLRGTDDDDCEVWLDDRRRALSPDRGVGEEPAPLHRLGSDLPPGRSGAGYRLFDTDALWCVDLIGRLRGLGLTVAEIRELCRHRHDGQPVGPLLAEQLRVSRARIEARVAELLEAMSRIDAYVSTHQEELADPTEVCWTGDPRCAANA